MTASAASSTHLVSLGHRDIACIAGPQAVSTGFNRYNAFLRHREIAGLQAQPRPRLLRQGLQRNGRRALRRGIAGRRAAIQRLVCANDRLAVGAISAFRRHGIACPGDVSVTGFNDMPLADRLSPPLTTVRVQHYKAGFEAAGADGRYASRTNADAAAHVVLPVEIDRPRLDRDRCAEPYERTGTTEAAGEHA